MRTTSRVALLTLVAVPTACASVTEAPKADTSLNVGDTYIFRGVPQATGGVLQGDMRLAVTDEDGATYSLSTWANMNLSQEGDDGVFPGGKGGKVTEIDVTPEYSRRFGAWTVATGLVSYAFPNGVGTGTTEAYVSAAFDSPLNPTLVMFYDFEEADGAYLNAAVAHTWQVAESVTVDAGLSLGYADAQQGAFYFGDESAGLADLVAQLGATYAASQHVSLTAALAGSSVLSSKYRDALDAGDLAADNVVALVGVAWSF